MARGKSLKIKINIQPNITWNAETEQALLTLSLATKTQTSLTRFTSIRLVKQEDFCGAIALTYFVENCLDLLLNGI